MENNDEIDLGDALAELSAEINNPDIDSLKMLKKYVDDWIEYKRRLKFLDDKTKEQKEEFNKVSQSYIPDLLAQFNLKDITLGTGEKIKIKTEVNPNIKKGYEDEFYDYLEKRGEDSIIDNVLIVKDPSKELIKLVREQVLKEMDESEEGTDTDIVVKKTINTNTLKAYCRRRVENDGFDDKPENFTCYIYSKTDIK